MSTITGPQSGDDLRVAVPNQPEINSPAPDSLNELEPTQSRNSSKTWILAGVAIVVLGLLIPWFLGSLKQDSTKYVYHRVQSTVLPITVTERGNLESQQNLKVFCEVDDIGGDGIEGTGILFIVPNGTEVKKGDKLVQLDSSAHLERLDNQMLKNEQAIAMQLQAKIKYENQITQNKTLEDQAKLAVELAELQLDMFKDTENGTSVLEAAEINREIDDTENEILAAKASLQLIGNEMRGTEELFKLGYAGKSELDRTRLDYLQAQSSLTAKINRLETQMGTLSKKTDFERKMSIMQFTGDWNTAQRELTQTTRNNEANLAQAKVALDAANRKLEKEQERLARYEQQLKNCTIYAQQDGMVAYATPSRYSRTSTIGEGALLRERQHILSLPNLRTMQVKTSVHESVQNQIQEGMACTVRLDAFPERTYAGTVKSIGVLPQQGSWSSSDTKMYETYVTIDDEVDMLKPGMTAVVEIHVDRLEDVLTVPVQAVQQEEKSTFCYVDESGRIRRVEIEVGLTNDKFVEIKSGLNENDRVILNPLAVTEAT